jgi:hypothetical protein
MQRIVRAALALLVSGLAAGAAQGYEPHVNYQLHCMGCHLADGSGAAGRVPTMRRTLVAFSAVPAGREFLVRVPGAAQSPLSDAELATLLNWMTRALSDQPVPAGFVDYTAEEVGRVRHRPLARVLDERKRLLEITGAE